MGWGLQIRTTRGISDLSDIKAIRKVWDSGRRTAASDSITLAAGTLPGGPYIIGVEVADRRNPPSVSVSGQTVTWTGVSSNDNSPSNDFVISLYKI